MHNDTYIQLMESAFAEAACEFCKLVEQLDGLHAEQWLEAIGPSLQRLETAIGPLTDVTPPSPHVWGTALEERFELYFRIKTLLGDQDEYWSEADLRAGDGYMTGSLSDDFADIYFELKQGLARFAQGPAGQHKAALLWTSSYRHHWRQHLIDARKQLFDFRPHKTAKTGTSILVKSPRPRRRS